MAETKSLYERLGGVYPIAAVVDAFIDRIMGDPRLNANPKVNEAHHRVSKAGFKYLKTHMTVPGPLNFHQAVTRWVIERQAR